MTQNIILPCEDCVCLAMCVGKELIICDDLWNRLENCAISSYQERLWTIICERLPNMHRIRWETNPHPVHKWHETENHVYAKAGCMAIFEENEK